MAISKLGRPFPPSSLAKTSRTRYQGPMDDLLRGPNSASGATTRPDSPPVRIRVTAV